MGALARAGRDKLTFVIEPDARAARRLAGAARSRSPPASTGMGIVPVDGEPLGRARRSTATTASSCGWARAGRRLAAATRRCARRARGRRPPGHRHRRSRGGAWVGGEFFRWEVATAIAGHRPGRRPLRRAQRDGVEGEHPGRAGALPPRGTCRRGPARRSGHAARRRGRGLAPGAVADAAPSCAPTSRASRANGYHAICAYIAPTPERDGRAARASRRCCATGRATRPRSATARASCTPPGQLHKGGAAQSAASSSWSAGHPDDLPIPGRKETFGVLIDAQALGDFASLGAHGLPVLRVHLSDDPDAGLAELARRSPASAA